jgi:hypothetical protein
MQESAKIENRRESQQEMLDIFLKSYHDDYGHLPSSADIKHLEATFGQLPDWVIKEHINNSS